MDMIERKPSRMHSFLAVILKHCIVGNLPFLNCLIPFTVWAICSSSQSLNTPQRLRRNPSKASNAFGSVPM